MSPEEYERLRLAERFCLLYGWSAVFKMETERQKAAHVAWQEWHKHTPEGFTRKGRHPELSDKVIADLADRFKS